MQAHQRLKDYMILIEQNRQIQEANNVGLTMTKTKLREDLIQLIQQFLAALRAYATSTKNIELKTKVSYTSSSLLRAADPILYDIGLLIYNLAFNSNDALLKDEIDVLIMPYQFTQPDFYHEYRSARSIVDTGGNRNAKTSILKA